MPIMAGCLMWPDFTISRSVSMD